MAPPRAVTFTVVPTSQQRRAFRQWAGPRGVATLPGNGFDVPAELLADLPHELLYGARVNGQVYLPLDGQPGHDAPPIDDEDGPLEVVAGFPTQRAYPLDLDDSP